MTLVPGLVRPSNDRMIAGVCAGIADYLKVDVGLVRAITFIAVAFAGLSVWVYPLLWLVMPEQGAERSGIDDVMDRAKGFAAEARARRDQSAAGRPTEVFNPYVDDDRR